MGAIVNKPTLHDLRNVGEYANNFRWNMAIPEPPVFWDSVGLDTEKQKLLNVLCESTSLPKKTVGKIPIILRGHQFFQPGIVLPESSITLNFIENVTGIVHTFFQTWQESIWATNIGQGYSYDELVAKTIMIMRLNNKDEVICVYNLKYCFLQGYTLPTLSGADNNVFRVGVTLSYDDFYISERMDSATDIAGADIGPTTWMGQQG